MVYQVRAFAVSSTHPQLYLPPRHDKVAFVFGNLPSPYMSFTRAIHLFKLGPRAKRTYADTQLARVFSH